MKKPEAWTAYDQGDPVYVYDVSEADEYSNALEAALAEAMALLRDAWDALDTEGVEMDEVRAFLDKHGGESECEND